MSSDGTSDIDRPLARRDRRDGRVRSHTNPPVEAGCCAAIGNAIRRTPDGDQRVEIQGRCVQGGGYQRVGAFDLEGTWDVVFRALLDEEESYEAGLEAVTEALQRPVPRRETSAVS